MFCLICMHMKLNVKQYMDFKVGKYFFHMTNQISLRVEGRSLDFWSGQIL